jgi:hypothetical protein
MAGRQTDGVEWMLGDVREMPEVATDSVDVAFDKGTFDAMVYGSPWNPPRDVRDSVRRYMTEVRTSLPHHLHAQSH